MKHYSIDGDGSLNKTVHESIVSVLDGKTLVPHNGAYTAEQFFDQLKLFVGELDEEEKRGVRESLNEEELAIFDLLSQGIELSEKERAEVKNVARQLLEKSLMIW
ncbi:MAG: hypothetical protein V7754_18100 [Halioglobus sp.]